MLLSLYPSAVELRLLLVGRRRPPEKIGLLTCRLVGPRLCATLQPARPRSRPVAVPPDTSRPSCLAPSNTYPVGPTSGPAAYKNRATAAPKLLFAGLTPSAGAHIGSSLKAPIARLAAAGRPFAASLRICTQDISAAILGRRPLAANAWLAAWQFSAVPGGARL